jgi:DNA-binding response OmpR family regulator
MARIIVCEDNDNLREAVISYLRLADHEVIELTTGNPLISLVKKEQVDCIILDVMLPESDGFILAKEIRRFSRVPIIFLTAKTSESDRITGFEVGGDDYVIKPFSPKELVLRVNALLQRTACPGKEPVNESWLLDKSQLTIDASSHKITVDSREIALTAAEWKLLMYLVQKENQVLSRSQLLTNSLDYLTDTSERTIDTHIKNIRLKLGDTRWIETVRGFGYRFNGKKV